MADAGMVIGVLAQASEVVMRRFLSFRFSGLSIYIGAVGGVVVAMAMGGGVAEAQSWTQQPLYQYPDQQAILEYFSDYGSTPMQTSDGIVNGTEAETSTWYRGSPSGFNFDVLLSYADRGQGGLGPTGRPLAASDGNLYGSYADDNALYEVTPAGAVNFISAVYSGESYNPEGNPVETNAGTVYGYGLEGYNHGIGVIYQLVLPDTFTVLYTFPDNVWASWLLVGADGNLYGTTPGAGDYSDGSIFKLTPAGTLTTLYSFTGGADGSSPESLIQGSDGNFYGITKTTAFQYQPTGTLETLHTFNSAANGYNPIPDLFEGSDGNFYGATTFKSKTQPGFVYQLTTAGKFTVVANTFSDIEYPTSGLLQGADGNFYISYGATDYAPQPYGLGGLAELIPPAAMKAPVELSASASTVAAGSPVTLTWSVSNLAAGTNKPCFASGGWSGWQAVSGTAVVTPATAGGATYGLTCGGFESNSVTVNVTSSSQKITTTVLAVAPLTIVQSGTVALTATVTGTGSNAPTGTVNFYNGSGQKLGSAAVTAGVAVLNASQVQIPVGNYSIYAGYLGDANNSPSQSAAVNVAVRAGTATTMTVSASPVVQGQPVTLAANIVNSTNGGTATYGGTVAFYYGDSVIATVPVTTAGSATLYVPQANVPVGTYSVTAHYSGDATHAPSISLGVGAVVKAQSRVVLTATPNPVVSGQSVTFTVKVTAAQAGDPVATGTVALYTSAGELGWVTLNGSGQASLTGSSAGVPAGAYPVQADYKGDGNYVGGGALVEVTITP